MQLKKSLLIIFLFISATSMAVNETMDSTMLIEKQKKAEKFYNQGVYFGQSGVLDSALYYTRKAINLYESMTQTDSTLLAHAYQSLGIINNILGKYDESFACYNKAEEIYLLKDNQPLLAYIYGNKANNYFTQQDFSKAKDFYFRAVNIFKTDSLLYKNQLAMSYNNLGCFFKKNNDYLNAVKYYNKSLRLKDKNNLLYTTIGNLALCFDKLQDHETAKNYYIKAIKITEKIYDKNNINTAAYYLDYAIFSSSQKNKNEAFRYFNLAINIYNTNFEPKHPDLSSCYRYLGEHYLNYNKIDSALFYFQKSLIALSPDFNDTSINSNPSINQVLSKTHFLSSLKSKAFALSEQASRSHKIERYKLSISTYDLAIEVIDKIRSGYLSVDSKLFLANNEFETFSNALQSSYELYKLTQEQKYLEKAFSYSEAGKSAILTEALKNIHALNIGGIPDSLISREKQLEKNIWIYEELIYEENKRKDPDQINLKYWNNSLFEKKQEFDELRTYLENNYQKYHSLKNAQNTLTIVEIQKKLSSKDLLIEYYLTDDKIYTIFIGKTESDMIELNIDESFHDHLGNLLESLSNNNFSNHGLTEFKSYQESSFYVYTRLLKAIENKIKDKNLIIIPDGKLAYLPFEVLTTKNQNFDRINYKNLPYLLYNNRINYSYSATLLFENNTSEQKAGKKLAAFAPTYTSKKELPDNFSSYRQEYRENLFPLKGIIDEVQKISELINGDQFLNQDASEKTFKEVAPYYDILHLAMHTIIDDKNPMYSKMAFTKVNDSTEDGFLNTYELYNMKLNSRMAVLSSCNSGRGKLQRGEGVMSMARGFIYSGCPSIVMTLWSVEDKSGVKLMTSFYENLLEGKTKSESLQLSKIDFINNADQLKSHPYFWSGYVVIGSNNALFYAYKNYVIFSGIVLLLLTMGILFILRLRKKN